MIRFEHLLSITKASKLCGVNPQTFLKWVKDGKVNSIVNPIYPSKMFIKREEVNRLLSHINGKPVDLWGEDEK